MESLPFGKTGETLSALGFGAAPLGGAYGPVTEAGGKAAVRRALELGVTVFDTSPYYGATLSESRLGAALEGARDDVFLITKCGRYGEAEFDFSAGRVAKSIDESLGRLRTDRVDLLLVHDVEFGDRERIAGETLPALLAAKEAGKARYVGVSGYPLDALEGIAAAFPIDAVLSYCHGNLMDRTLFHSALPAFEARGQAVINASTLHMGVLTNSGPPPWHPAPPEVRLAGQAVAKLCQEYGREVTDVALQFALAQPGLACTLVGVESAGEIERNVKALAAGSNGTDEVLLAAIDALVAPVRDRTWPSGNWA